MRSLILLIAILCSQFATAAEVGLGPLPPTASVITLAGDVTGSGSANTVAKVNGTTLGTTAVTAGTLLGGSGSDIRSLTLTAGTGLTLTTAASALTLQPKVYLLSSDCSAHSITGTASETVLKTFSVTAATTSIPTNSIVVVRTLWTTTGTGNKQCRVRIGAAGAGTGGTALANPTFTTTATEARDVYIYCRGASSQVTYASASTAHEGTSNNAMVSGAINLASDWEIAITGTLTTTSENIQLEAAAIELYVP